MTATEPSRVGGDKLSRVARARPFVIAAAIAACLAAMTYLVMVRTRLGQRFDNAALVGSMQQSASSRLSDTFFLERISAWSFAVVLLVIVGLGLARRRPRLGIAVAGSAVIGLLVTDFLKNHVLTRPFYVPSDAIRSANSFPSGHTAIAIGCAFALVVLAPPAIRGVVAILAGSYSWAVAADVQSAGWHRPSDAIGSVLLCFALICIVVALLIRALPLSTGRRITHIPAFVILAIVWVFSLTLAIYNAVRVLRVLERTTETATLTDALLNHSYLFSISLTVTIVVTALIALLVLLGAYDLDAPRRLSRRV